MDLEGEGKPVKPDQLKFIHRAKTAALLTSAIRLGAMSANASPARLASLTDFGQALGLAFQVIDDILDVTQTTDKLGKTAGKDVAATKATYPAIFGLEPSREEARRLTEAAHAALGLLGKGSAAAGAGGLFAGARVLRGGTRDARAGRQRRAPERPPTAGQLMARLGPAWPAGLAPPG